MLWVETRFSSLMSSVGMVWVVTRPADSSAIAARTRPVSPSSWPFAR
jgi:hypothetical protein